MVDVSFSMIYRFHRAQLLLHIYALILIALITSHFSFRLATSYLLFAPHRTINMYVCFIKLYTRTESTRKKRSAASSPKD